MKVTLMLLITMAVGQVSAQDIMGAYIHTKRLPNTNTLSPVYEYSITVTLFTDASKNISRPTIPIAFGDGNSGTYTLTTSSITNGIKESKYSAKHIYSGAGNYLVNYLDTFRVTGIKNISNSQIQKISVGSQLIINPFIGQNTSPQVSIYPLNLSVAGNQVVYTPLVSDIDGDSLSFFLINCFATNYYLPNGASITNSGGVISFSRDSIGLYAFCFTVKQWRKNTSSSYVDIGSSQVDFLLDITTTVGINELLLKDLSMFVHPNPVKDVMHLTFDNETKIDKITITNALGQVAYSSKNFNQTQEIDISFLSNGIYFLKAENKQWQRVFKIIKE